MILFIHTNDLSIDSIHPSIHLFIGESNIIRRNIFQAAFVTACRSVVQSNDDDVYGDKGDGSGDIDNDNANGDGGTCLESTTSPLSPSHLPPPSSLLLSSPSKSQSSSSPSSNYSWSIDKSALPAQLGMI